MCVHAHKGGFQRMSTAKDCEVVAFSGCHKGRTGTGDMPPELGEEQRTNYKRR